MSFGSLESDDDNSPLAEINMVPLIDVMLVLLVIFLITAPLLTHAVRIDLPRAASSPDMSKPETVQLSIDAESRVYWNGQQLDKSALRERMNTAAASSLPPVLHIRAERTTPYETVAQIMSDAARAGLTKIGLVTDPSTQ